MYIDFVFNATETPPQQCVFYEINKNSARTDGSVMTSSQNGNFTCAWSAEEATQQIKVTVSCS